MDVVDPVRARLASLPDPLELLAGLFSHSPVPYAVFAADGHCVLVNAAYVRMFGRAPPPEYDILRDEVAEREGLKALIQSAFEGKTVSTPTVWYDPSALQHADGTGVRRVAIALSLFPLRGGEGAVTHVAVAYKDVTDLQLAAEAAAAERDLLRAILDQSGEAIIVADAEGVLRLMNPMAERLHGRAFAAASPEQWIEVYGLRDVEDAPLPVHELPLYRAVQGETVRDARWKVAAPDGALRTLEGTATPLRKSDGTPGGGVLVARDITERQRLEEAEARARRELANTERKLQAITNNATLGLVMMDARGHTVFLNRAAEQIIGLRLEQVQGGPLHDFIHHTHPDGTPFPMADCPIDRALPTRAQEQGEGVFVKPDGSFYPVAFTASPIIEDGHAVGTVLELRETSEDKRREREREKLLSDLQDAVALRDEFLSIASHELKTPLTPLSLRLHKLSTRFAAASLPSPEALQADVDAMIRQVRRLSHLIEELLDVSRISSGQLRLQLEDVDLGALLTEVVGRYEAEAERAGCSLHLQVAPGLVGQWDRLRLEQVISNLLSNAIKYGAASPVCVYAALEGGGDEAGDVARARIQVSDRGIGIPPEAMPRIFEKFGRGVSERHYGGLGLGLYVTRQIVSALGGSVTARSDAGNGTVLEVELPLRPRLPPSEG